MLAALFLSACGSSVKLAPPTIPEPLIEPIPMTVAVRMPADFQSYVHEEEVMGREEWTIDLGQSNAVFFEQLFGYMFTDMLILGEGDDPALASFDAMIEPSIDAFEFSVPAQTRTDSFAVWIRYRIKVYDRGGTLVSNWPVSAYGKSRTAQMSNSEALERAAILAMRDAAAQMIIKLDDQTQISGLSERTAPVPELEPGPTVSDEDDPQATAAAGSEDEAS